MKKLVAVAIIMIGAIAVYTRGTSIWANKENLHNWLTPDDLANGAIVPVMDLYDYLVDKVAYEKTEVVHLDFTMEGLTPHDDTSPNGIFTIQLRLGNILPIKDNQTGRVYQMMLPSSYGNTLNKTFSADSSIVILCLMSFPTYYTCGFSTHYDPAYDNATGNQSFLPAIFQIKRNALAAWIKDNHVIIWEKKRITWGNDDDNLHNYSLPILSELYHMFIDTANIPLLQLIQNARTTGNPVPLKPDQAKLFNSFKKEIQDTLKPFVIIGGPLIPQTGPFIPQ